MWFRHLITCSARLRWLYSFQHWILYWADSVHQSLRTTVVRKPQDFGHTEKHSLKSQLPLSTEGNVGNYQPAKCTSGRILLVYRMFLVTLFLKKWNYLEFPRIQENKESIDSFGATERVHHITKTSTTTDILAVGLGWQPKDWAGKWIFTPSCDPSPGLEPMWRGSSYWCCCSGCFWIAQSPWCWTGFWFQTYLTEDNHLSSQAASVGQFCEPKLGFCSSFCGGFLSMKISADLQLRYLTHQK